MSSTANKWSRMGEDIMNSVIHAVESGDFTGLSESVNELVSEAADSVGRGIHRVGKELGRDIGIEFGKPSVPHTQSAARGMWTRSNAAVRNEVPKPPERYRRYLPGQVSGPIFFIIGIIGAVSCGIPALITGLLYPFYKGAIPLAVPIVLVIVTLLFAACLVKGISLNGRNKRFRRYVREIGDRSYCRLEDLARAIGKKTSYAQKDIYDMLKKGYFLHGHLDTQRTTLILDNETYVQYKRTEEAQRLREQELARARQQQAQCPAEVQHILAEGEAYIRHVHECNDAIPGEAMSAKLAKLEDIMRRIFAQVRRQPECAPELHKLMTYYLPTTTKLIDAYCDLDGTPSYGANVANTKKEIEDTLDTINEAFENLFDSLFEDTAWDISSDISTMKVMLRQEGLTKNKDFK